MYSLLDRLFHFDFETLFLTIGPFHIDIKTFSIKNNVSVMAKPALRLSTGYLQSR